MSDIQILNEMFHDDARVPISKKYERYQVTLREQQCPDSSIVITGLPSASIVIKADSFRGQHGFFRGSKGECKNADYIIISDNGKKQVVIFIEMKRTKGLVKRLK